MNIDDEKIALSQMISEAAQREMALRVALLKCQRDLERALMPKDAPEAV